LFSLFGTRGRRKVVGIAATLSVALGGAVTAYAFWNAGGSGTASIQAGTPPTSYSLSGGTPTYAGGTSTTALTPGGTATYVVTITNTGGATNSAQGTVHLASISTDAAHAGCDTATNPTWFTQPDQPWTVVGTFATNGTTTVTATLTLVNTATNQAVCEGAPLTAHLVNN